ncbi:glyoxalase superfamily protein [Ruegeria sp. HKCCD9179]|uniref:glyoxalase superfamily protein n=1 Tax=unclassified Ruegeria TaxID=2625375 RepID=UPI00352C7F67
MTRPLPKGTAGSGPLPFAAFGFGETRFERHLLPFFRRADGNANPVQTSRPFKDTRHMMTRLQTVAPVEELKEQAKRLREKLKATGVSLSHSATLELLAHQHGVRDWNTLHAMAGNRMHLRVGDRVEGRYLGQAYTGEIRGITMLGDGARRRVTLHFDTPVDVVRFDSFSAYRQRVTGEIGWDGQSLRHTSNGEPQLVVRPV